MLHIGPVYKTNLVRTKSLSDHDPDQIWLCKRYHSVPKFWSGPKSRPKRDLLMCKGPRSDRIWSCTKSGYVNVPCSSDQTKSLTFGGKSQSSNKNGESATWCKLVNRWKLDYYKNLEFIMIANIWRKNDIPCSSRALLFIEILTPLGKVSQNTASSFLENLNLWCASFSRFVIQK